LSQIFMFRLFWLSERGGGNEITMTGTLVHIHLGCVLEGLEPKVGWREITNYIECMLENHRNSGGS
jgi:hypothetical protein